MLRIPRREFLQAAVATSLAVLLRRGRARDVPFVRALWSGALTPRSIRVNALLDRDSPTVRLLVSASSDLSQPLASAFQTADLQANNRTVSLRVEGLQPDVSYYYAVEAGGEIDATIGRFHTPAEGPFSFTLAFASCADTGSNHPVFDTIRSHNPLLYLNMGDLHYEDIGVNDRGRFRRAYERLLTQPRQAALYRVVPFAYMWDDHDYGPNDSDAASSGREAARLTYQEVVPHYPLAAGSGDVAIYQAFTIGRVRFILTDTRSERSPKDAPDTAEKSMLGAAQKAWFKQQLLEANGTYPVIVWVSTSPWMADLPGSGNDNWAGYATERRELADFIETAGIQGLIMLSGDVHMVAIEDGRNNHYGSGARGFPIMQAAPLDRANSSDLPDNTYSEGQFPGHAQFGLMTITDDGGPLVRIQWSGRTAADEELVALEMTVPPGPRLAVEPRALSFLRVAGGTERLKRPLTIANLGVGPMPWAITADPVVAWLDVSATGGSTTPETAEQIMVRANPSGLPPGAYATRLRVAAPGATYSPQVVEVTLLITAEPSTFAPVVGGG